MGRAEIVDEGSALRGHRPRAVLGQMDLREDEELRIDGDPRTDFLLDGIRSTVAPVDHLRSVAAIQAAIGIPWVRTSGLRCGRSTATQEFLIPSWFDHLSARLRLLVARTRVVQGMGT